jgi:anti-anti-sigma factor
MGTPHHGPGSQDHQAFSCAVERSGDQARMRLVGELDIASAPALEAQVDDLREDGARLIVLDLSEVTFMDSTGLRCVLRLDAASRADGFSLGLVAGPPAVQRIFDMTGTADRLPFVEP